MAHQVESAFFVGQKAWHGIGNVLQDPPTVAEAIRQAGLDWEVFVTDLVAGLETDDGVKSHIRVPSHRAVVRSSDMTVLGVVGNRYLPLQNTDAFAFFNTFIDKGQATLEAAGSLRNGQRIWILAKLHSSADIVKDDQVDSYLLLYSSHDGSLCVGVQFTMIRVVCANTLSASISAGKAGAEMSVTIRHTKRMNESLNAVADLINTSQRTFDLTVQQYQAMARKRLPIDGLEKYVKAVFESDKITDTETKEEKIPRALQAIKTSYHSGPGATIVGVEGSVWGAFNSVTDWIDHTRGRSADSRMEASWFGVGRTLRDRAFEIAMAM